jgi:flagellar basal body rod protein FlgC
VTISSVYNLAASGMQAAVVRQNAAARNSANLLSENPRRLVVSQTELSSGGTRAATAPVESLADPVADAVDRLLSVYAFKANVVSLRTADKMAGAVLNIRA